MRGPYASSRNNGWGREMGYAASNAIRALYVSGHFSTVETQQSRLMRFTAFLHHEGVRNLMVSDMPHWVATFAAHVRVCVELGIWSQKYGVSLITAVNRLMYALHGNERIWISPAETLGRRTQVRCEVPDGMDLTQVEAALAAMRQAGCKRAAAVLELASTFGVRVREACLADLDEWQHQARSKGHINVQIGTKGRRTADRLIKVNPDKMGVLERALAARPKGSRNLVYHSGCYLDLVGGEIAEGRAILKEHGIKNYRENRAAFACRRYRELTGFDAPTLTGGVVAPDEVDLRARRIISVELGHDRTDVLVSYIGGRKRAVVA